MNYTLLQYTAFINSIGGQEMLIILVILAIPIVVIIAVVKAITNASKSSIGQNTRSNSRSIEDRLRSLEALRRDGTITDAEYQDKRSQVMREL